MSTNACYGCVVCFLSKTQRKTCFAAAHEGVSIHNLHIYCTTSVKFDTKILHALLIHWALTCFVVIGVD